MKDELEKRKWERQNSTPAQAVDVTGKPTDVPSGMVETSSADMLKLIQDAMDEEQDEDDF